MIYFFGGCLSTGGLWFKVVLGFKLKYTTFLRLVSGLFAVGLRGLLMVGPACLFCLFTDGLLFKVGLSCFSRAGFRFIGDWFRVSSRLV